MDMTREAIKSTIHMSQEDKLLILLIRLKTNLEFSGISPFFGVNAPTISSSFYEALDAVYNVAKEMIFWPTRQQINARMPKSFRGTYPKCRVIIDATEIEIPRPADVRQANLTWSDYKRRHTIKFVVGKRGIFLIIY